MRPATRVAWWLGWHPRYAVGGGAVVGLLVGNVLVTWAVRATMLRGGVASAAAPLRQSVGGGTFLLVLAAVPVVGSILAGVALGLVTWLAGAWTVGRRADGVLADAFETDDRGDPSGATHRFAVGVDDRTPPLVSPARTYAVARVRLDESGMDVREGRFSLPERRLDLGATTRVAYEDVETVAYDPAAGTLRVETTTTGVTLRVARRPDALVDALRTRVPDATVEA